MFVHLRRQAIGRKLRLEWDITYTSEDAKFSFYDDDYVYPAETVVFIPMYIYLYIMCTPHVLI